MCIDKDQGKIDRLYAGTMCDSTYSAIEGANAPIMVDLSNIYKLENIRPAGFNYVSVRRS